MGLGHGCDLHSPYALPSLQGTQIDNAVSSGCRIPLAPTSPLLQQAKPGVRAGDIPVCRAHLEGTKAVK